MLIAGIGYEGRGPPGKDGEMGPIERMRALRERLLWLQLHAEQTAKKQGEHRDELKAADPTDMRPAFCDGIALAWKHSAEQLTTVISCIDLDIALAEMDVEDGGVASKEEKQPVYIVFDDGPGPIAGRFVEVETKDGKGVGGSDFGWEKIGSGPLWRLGPLWRRRRKP